MRPHIAIHVTRLLGLTLLLVSQAVRADMQADYSEAKRLMRAGRHEKASDLLQAAQKTADEQGDDYFAFFFARDFARCQEHLGNNPACIQSALKALTYLDMQAKSGSSRMSEATRLNEQCLLEGSLAKYYFYSHRISQARQWSERAKNTLAKLITNATGNRYDLMSGIKPVDVNDSVSSLIPRQLWFESMILDSEARTTKALKCLDAAERYLLSIEKKRDTVHDDYYLKVLNRKAQLLDFLGWLPDAIDIDRRVAELKPNGQNMRAIQGARLNLNRNLSQYYGPSETYLKEAIDACTQIDPLSDRVGSLSARRLVNKMVFDLRQDPAAVTNLAEITALLRQSGLQHDADYTDRDQLEIDIRTGTTEGVESRLLKLIETFRDNGNRTGEVTLFRNYGDLCYRLGRFDDAVYLYTRTLELSNSYGWYVHLPRIMALLAQTYIAKGDPAKADQWIQAIHAHLKAHPDLPAHRTADALLAIAQLQANLGRESDFLATKQALLAYSQKTHVPDYWTARLKSLTAENVNKEPRPAASADGARQTDLQPRKVVSESFPGEPAVGRFTVVNLTGNSVTGKLLYPDSAKLVMSDGPSGVVRLEANPAGNGKQNASLPLQIGPSGLIRVFMEAQVKDADSAGSLALQWLPEAGLMQASTWEYRATDKRSEITVANANLAELNPFYFVPLYHAIRKRGPDEKLFDFSVISSIPCHIEVVDAASGEVIAIDRQGDGSFDKEGDFVFQDSNGNLYPDHAFAADEDSFGIDIHVYPTNHETLKGGEEITITVLVALGDQWQELAEDILKARKP